MVSYRHHYIRITAVPPGEAPDWVRAEWVGLVMPISPAHLLGYDGEGEGVLSRDPEWVIGQAVDIQDAMMALAAKSPAAAKWWRDNTPTSFYPGSVLIFDDDVCEKVDGP